MMVRSIAIWTAGSRGPATVASMTQHPGDSSGVRLDQWLHAARFFKTRGLASVAVKAHRVLVNEARVKPARPLRVGDRVSVVRGHERMEVDVLQLSTRRGPASVARTLYAETEDSAAARARLAEDRRLKIASSPQPPKRPDKRSRRHLIRFQRRGADGPDGDG